MLLTEEQISELIKANGRGESYEQAELHDSWSRFFSEYTYFGSGNDNGFGDSDFSGNNRAAKVFFRRLKNMLGFSSDKYKRIVEVFENTLPNILEAVLDVYGSVYSATDRVINIRLKDEKSYGKFQAYRESFLKDEKFMSQYAHKNLAAGINNVIVIDRRKNGNPYFLQVPHHDIIACKLVRSRDLPYMPFAYEYFIFKRGESIFVYDEQTYKEYRLKPTNGEKYSGKKEALSYEFYNSSEHKLGYTPAVNYYHEFINDDPYQRRSPFTFAFPVMRQFLLHEVGRSYYELYGKYPIFKTPERSCNYKRESDQAECSGGLLYIGMEAVSDFGQLSQCPICREEGFIMPGSQIEIDASSENAAANAAMIGFINVDSAALNFNKERSAELKNELEQYLIGSDASPSNQAVNDSQIDYLRDRRVRNLKKISNNLEITHKFILDTAARLFDSANFEGSNVDYGLKFTYLTDSQALAEYQAGKEIQLPDTLLTDSLKQYIVSRFKSSPIEQSRELFKLKLTPYPNLNIDQLLLLNEKGIASKRDVDVRVNMSWYISKFELEKKMTIDSYLSQQSNLSTRSIESVIEEINEFFDECFDDNREEIQEEITGEESNEIETENGEDLTSENELQTK